MKPPAFTDDLRTGLRAIDHQHEEIFARAHRVLAAAGEAAADPRALDEWVAYLTRYVTYHFRAEEHAMNRFGFPGLEHHRRQHDRLRARVEEMQRARGLPARVRKLDVEFFLQDLLIEHVRGVDIKLAAFLRDAGADSPDLLGPPSEFGIAPGDLDPPGPRRK